ncbi:surface protein [Actinomyces sp. Chiba101]|nr:surface protein [Actinomyces sp. Chiba101]
MPASSAAVESAATSALALLIVAGEAPVEADAVSAEISVQALVVESAPEEDCEPAAPGAEVAPAPQAATSATEVKEARAAPARRRARRLIGGVFIMKLLWGPLERVLVGDTIDASQVVCEAAVNGG